MRRLNAASICNYQDDLTELLANVRAKTAFTLAFNVGDGFIVANQRLDG